MVPVQLESDRPTAGTAYPVPSYVPPVALPLLPWARGHVRRVAARYGVSRDDLWDEAITALLRASCHWQPGRGAFGPYARTAVHRGLWQFVVRGHVRRSRHGRPVPLADVVECQELTVPSAEAEAIARDAARRAWALREHAALADTRGDDDTTTRLLEAAREADSVARRRQRAAATTGA